MEFLPKENLERGYIAVADNAFGLQIALRPQFFEHVIRAIAAARRDQGSDLRIAEQSAKMGEARVGRGRKIGLRLACERILRQKSQSAKLFQTTLNARFFSGRSGREDADARTF